MSVYCNVYRCAANLDGKCEDPDTTIRWDEKLQVPICDSYEEEDEP